MHSISRASKARPYGSNKNAARSICSGLSLSQCPRRGDLYGRPAVPEGRFFKSLVAGWDDREGRPYAKTLQKM